eukprot:2077053-Pleurochrysis_carterae.AAC.3
MPRGRCKHCCCATRPSPLPPSPPPPLRARTLSVLRRIVAEAATDANGPTPAAGKGRMNLWYNLNVLGEWRSKVMWYNLKVLGVWPWVVLRHRRKWTDGQSRDGSCRREGNTPNSNCARVSSDELKPWSGGGETERRRGGREGEREKEREG